MNANIILIIFMSPQNSISCYTRLNAVNHIIVVTYAKQLLEGSPFTISRLAWAMDVSRRLTLSVNFQKHFLKSMDTRGFHLQEKPVTSIAYTNSEYFLHYIFY